MKRKRKKAVTTEGVNGVVRFYEFAYFDRDRQCKFIYHHHSYNDHQRHYSRIDN